MIFVSGAQIKSWPGNLATPTTPVTKANNTTSLNTGSSWVGGVTPGLYNQAVWDSTVTAANIFSTSPAIPQNKLVVLEDPKNNFLAGNVVPLVNSVLASLTIGPLTP